jgi:hypothetical protein
MLDLNSWFSLSRAGISNGGSTSDSSDIFNLLFKAVYSHFFHLKSSNMRKHKKSFHIFLFQNRQIIGTDITKLTNYAIGYSSRQHKLPLGEPEICIFLRPLNHAG